MTIEQAMALDKLFMRSMGIEFNLLEVTYKGDYDASYIHIEDQFFKRGYKALRRTYDAKNNITITVYEKPLLALKSDNVIIVDFKAKKKVP